MIRLTPSSHLRWSCRLGATGASRASRASSSRFSDSPEMCLMGIPKKNVWMGKMVVLNMATKPSNKIGGTPNLNKQNQNLRRGATQEKIWKKTNAQQDQLLRGSPLVEPLNWDHGSNGNLPSHLMVSYRISAVAGQIVGYMWPIWSLKACAIPEKWCHLTIIRGSKNPNNLKISFSMSCHIISYNPFCVNILRPSITLKLKRGQPSSGVLPPSYDQGIQVAVTVTETVPGWVGLKIHLILEGPWLAAMWILGASKETMVWLDPTMVTNG